MGIAVLAAPSCSGKTDTGGTAATPVPEEELPATVASAICDNIGPCCAASGYAHDAATCRLAIEAEISQNFSDIRGNPAIVYDAEAAGRCVAGLTSAVRGCTQPNNPVADDSCERIFRGTLAEGEVCTSSDECAYPPGGGAYCESDPTGTVSHCTVDTGDFNSSIRGGVGDACGSTCTDTGDGSTGCSIGAPALPPGSGGGPGATPGQATCWTNDGVFCDMSTYRCTALAQIGQACLSSGCVSGAFCEAGVCAPQRTTGDCLTYYDACAGTAYCDSLTYSCAPKKPNGSSCAFYDECVGGNCTESAVCGDDTVASASLCAGNL